MMKSEGKQMIFLKPNICLIAFSTGSSINLMLAEVHEVNILIFKRTQFWISLVDMEVFLEKVNYLLNMVTKH